MTQNMNQEQDRDNQQNTTEKDESVSLAEALEGVFDNAKFPNPTTVVTGELDAEKIKKAAEAGIEHIINLQGDDELTFDEKAVAESHGIHYTQLPISGAEDLKQLNLLEFDKILRQHHGKKTLMHCKTGNRVGACVALRAGWLRGRKMDTAMQRGRDHGLTGLEQEVHNRLLVPR